MNINLTSLYTHQSSNHHCHHVVQWTMNSRRKHLTTHLMCKPGNMSEDRWRLEFNRCCTFVKQDKSNKKHSLAFSQSEECYIFSVCAAIKQQIFQYWHQYIYLILQEVKSMTKMVISYFKQLVERVWFVLAPSWAQALEEHIMPLCSCSGCL